MFVHLRTKLHQANHKSTNVRSLLQKKIPVSNHIKFNLIDTGVSTILVFICLLSFKPSFISEIRFADQVIVSAIISLVTFSVLLLKCFILNRMEQTGEWTFKQDLASLFIVFFAISVILSILSPFVLNSWLKLSLVIDVRFILILTGFVHLIGLLLYFISVSARFAINGQQERNNTLEYADKQEELLKPQPESIDIVIEGKNQGEKLVTQKENLVCISTSGHYVDILILDGDKLKKLVFRNTILSISNSLEKHDDFVQCHRSHLINFNHIENLIGGSKKMEVKFKNLDLKIPVSRNKVNLLTQMMEDKSN